MFPGFSHHEESCHEHQSTDFCVNIKFHFSRINAQSAIAGSYVYILSNFKTSRMEG